MARPRKDASNPQDSGGDAQEFATISGAEYDKDAAKWRRDGGLAPYKAGFNRGNMDMRTLVALREKLVILYKKGQSTEEEMAFMEVVLKFFRKRGQLSSADTYLLNEIENERCEDVCWVAHDNAPVVLGLRKDLECRFRMDAINQRVEVFVPKIIPPLSQLTYEQALAQANNQPVTNLPQPKKLLRRLDMKYHEFIKWFKIDDETILAQPEAAPSAITL